MKSLIVEIVKMLSFFQGKITADSWKAMDE